MVAEILDNKDLIKEACADAAQSQTVVSDQDQPTADDLMTNDNGFSPGVGTETLTETVGGTLNEEELFKTFLAQMLPGPLGLTTNKLNEEENLQQMHRYGNDFSEQEKEELKNILLAVLISPWRHYVIDALKGNIPQTTVDETTSIEKEELKKILRAFFAPWWWFLPWHRGIDKTTPEDDGLRFLPWHRMFDGGDNILSDNDKEELSNSEKRFSVSSVIPEEILSDNAQHYGKQEVPLKDLLTANSDTGSGDDLAVRGDEELSWRNNFSGPKIHKRKIRSPKHKIGSPNAKIVTPNAKIAPTFFLIFY